MIRKISLILSVLFLGSCNYRIDKMAGKQQAPGATRLEAHELTYKLVNEQVLGGKCLNCHSEAGGNRGGLNLESYKSVFDNREMIRSEILGRTMPKSPTSPLSDSQLQMVISWIDAGALEFGGARPSPPVAAEPAPPVGTPPVVAPPSAIPPITAPPVVGPEPSPVPPVVAPTPPESENQLTFASVMEKVIGPKCLKCHDVGARNGVVLKTYEEIVAAQGEIRFDVEQGIMPKRDTLTQEQKKLIIDWIDAGLPKT